MPLDFDTQPLREMRKGRTLQWDPHAIDLDDDRAHWNEMNQEERTVILGMVLGFLVGERAVTHDLAPLQQALRHEGGHMDEEMYLTQQQFEESTHVEFFQRWLFEVLPGELGKDIPYPPGDPSPVLRDHLPKAMMALRDDTSRRAQLRATVVYHQIVEGVLAEIGYQHFYDCLDERGLLPGLRQGVRNIQLDESRHIAFGTYLARRLVRENPELREAFEADMDEMLEPSRRSTRSLFEAHPDPMPFGLSCERSLAMCDDFFRRRKASVLEAGLAPA